MLLAASALKGYDLAATDGLIGRVKDVLFDDQSWKLRWLVVDAGSWLTGRKVLIHPSAISLVDYERQVFSVKLTKAQVQASPGLDVDAPVSRQMQDQVYNYYGWDPYWGPNYFGTGGMALPMPVPMRPLAGGVAAIDETRAEADAEPGDVHLRSAVEVTGYHIHASDGAIGHVENFLVDDAGWGIRYLIVDTRNWWPGKHVLVSPYAVRGIDWPNHEVRLDVTRDKVKESPPWNPPEAIDRAYEARLHLYYGWPGYGF